MAFKNNVAQNLCAHQSLVASGTHYKGFFSHSIVFEMAIPVFDGDLEVSVRSVTMFAEDVLVIPHVH